jgi:hypothetical protein
MMEQNLTKLAKAFSILFICVSAYHSVVEFMPKQAVLYKVVQEVILPESTTKLTVNNETFFSVFVQPIDEKKVVNHELYQLKITQEDYFRLSVGDSVIIYFSPYKHEVRGYLYAKMPGYYSIKNPLESRLLISFEHIGLPLITLFLSLCVFFVSTFEVKIALFLFNIIFITVLQWFNG